MSTLRHVAAAKLSIAAGWLSATTGRGSGRAITGKVLMALSPGSLPRLVEGRRLVLVSGTNGKSTTSRLVAEAWRAQGPVTTNDEGSNLVHGVASALLRSPHERTVLEVDEVALASVLACTTPEVLVLLNLARDQLDRFGEVSKHVRIWNEVLRRRPVGRIVVNADDPLVVAAVEGAISPVTWVSAGLLWQDDARSCRRCAQPVTFADGDWWCDACGLRRPTPDAQLRDGTVQLPDGTSLELDLQLPGDWNRTNAALALVAAEALGVRPEDALQRISRVDDVDGRYSSGRIAGHEVRLLLAKNPASARSVLELLVRDQDPVVLVLNAEAADGRDPSWLWDVPFEVLRGRRVVATGRRAADLSVRLHYAQVEHDVAPDLESAVARIGTGPCHVVGNYTAFTSARARLRSAA